MWGKYQIAGATRLTYSEYTVSPSDVIATVSHIWNGLAWIL